MQVTKEIVDMLRRPYRHISSLNYDLPQGLVNAWLSCGRDFQLAFDIETDKGANSLVYWWLTTGREMFTGIGSAVDSELIIGLHLNHLRVGDLRSEPMRSDQLAPAEENVSDDLSLTPLLSIIWSHRSDLQDTIDIHKSDGVSLLWQWWRTQGVREYPVEASVSDHNASIKQQDVEMDRPPVMTSTPLDVCLVGYPRGEFGLGEDIRKLRASLQTIGVDPTVVRAPWHIIARQNIDEAFIESDLAEFDTEVIFYVMPAFDTMTLLNKVGPKAFSARRRIGFWQWELDHFPDPASAAFDLIDEIWCHSEHAAKAFRGATRKPVYKVPLPVSVPKPTKVSRSVFGLSESAFVFLTSFDGASFIARKNPLATILAFQEAFGSDQPDVTLVVKAMNIDSDPLWRECLRKAAADKRIVIMEGVMDHDVYYQLLRNCDAVISLHRAEGFGRLMAEAMAMGIPVIASRYSGNLDFTNDTNSWLIGGSMVPVLPGDYPFYHDQQWFEPSISEAANAMQECATNEKRRGELAAEGKREILSNYSLKSCGEAYRRLLQASRSPN